MFSLPLLEEDSTIIIDGTLESKSYIDMTIEVLDSFGISIKEVENGYFIEGSQSYTPNDYRIEGDFSQAAFYLVAGVLSGNVKVDDLSAESSQGDKKILDIIKSMNGKLVFAENGFITEKSQTNSTTIDLSDCPDLGPIVSLLASLSKGTTHIINAGRLRIKESDRIESTVATLKALGANITSTEDSITIIGRKSLTGGVSLDSNNDHRIAMMLAIAATRCDKPITIERANAVNKSYPHFFEDYRHIGGKIK
jgi:3-phosphoshikimate 1-carboxyvinyltransferase